MSKTSLKDDGVYVEAYSATRKTAILSNGIEVPICNGFDDDGDPCDIEEATSFVAGEDDVGWFVIMAKDFETVTVH